MNQLPLTSLGYDLIVNVSLPSSLFTSSKESLSEFTNISASNTKKIIFGNWQKLVLIVVYYCVFDVPLAALHLVLPTCHTLYISRQGDMLNIANL